MTPDSYGCLLESWAYIRGWTGRHVALLFDVEGTPCVLFPYFLGIDIFCNVLITHIYFVTCP